MGGRGTYASGKNAPYTYKTVGKIDGVKVLQPLKDGDSFSMPAESHSSSCYIVLDKKGVFRQYTEYNQGHLPVFEIGYHFEKGISKAGEAVFHVHDYSAPGIENRSKGRAITSEEFKKYKKFFKGVS